MPFITKLLLIIIIIIILTTIIAILINIFLLDITATMKFSLGSSETVESLFTTETKSFYIRFRIPVT
jgi:hypothetical protein